MNTNPELPFEIVARHFGAPARARLIIRLRDSNLWLALRVRHLDSQRQFRAAVQDAVMYSDPNEPWPCSLGDPVSDEQWDAWFKKALGDFKEREQSR